MQIGFLCCNISRWKKKENTAWGVWMMTVRDNRYSHCPDFKCFVRLFRRCTADMWDNSKGWLTRGTSWYWLRWGGQLFSGELYKDLLLYIHEWILWKKLVEFEEKEKNEAKSAEFFLCYLVDSDFRKEYCI